MQKNMFFIYLRLNINIIITILKHTIDKNHMPAVW